jgi:spoIIIJ-associated protein
MAHEYEFEGKNVDQALEAASNALQKPVEQLEYDVVSYGSSGIFGLVGAKKAKIRIRNGQVSRRTATPRQKAKDLVRDAFQLAEEPQAKAQPEPAPAPAPQGSGPRADA